ncbi:MAG: rhodanese-like domain-containing protein [Arcobacteraceae bacterium]
MKIIKYLIIILIMSVSSYCDLIEIDNLKLQQMIADGVVVIDIRRQDEFEEFGIIKGSTQLTFFDKNGNYDVPKWINSFVKLVPTKDTPFAIYCAHANRTKVVGNFLNKQLEYKNVYELKGGINYGWIDKGFPTVKY